MCRDSDYMKDLLKIPENLTYETIQGQIVGKANNYQAVPDKQGGKRIIKNAAIRKYEKSFCKQCSIYKDKQINKPFVLIVHVFESKLSYDLDNALKTLLDCLQYVGAVTNDNLCVGIKATKHIDRQQPRITFALQEVEPSLF